MTTSRRFLPVVLLALLWAGSLEAQSGTLRDAWTSPCTLDVVLVTFRDTTGMHMGGRNAMGDTIWADAFNYDDHDLPHGYTIASDGALSPGTSSYTMDDFKRLLSGGYNYSVNGEPAELIPAYTGTPTVADNNDGVSETLPEVFGSLRHYFHAASGGDFELHVRILNLERDEYPVWVQLPQTKGYYAERFDPMMEEIFWLDAESTMRDSVRAWGLDPAAYNPPDDTYTTDRRLRHKVLYLHSGPEFHDERDNRNSRIHPRVDEVTWIAATGVVTPGFRYVAGERRGSGSNSHRADRFASIGIHAHEIGHLLGLNHTGAPWRGTNPYTNQTTEYTAPSSIARIRKLDEAAAVGRSWCDATTMTKGSFGFVVGRLDAFAAGRSTAPAPSQFGAARNGGLGRCITCRR